MHPEFHAVLHHQRAQALRAEAARFRLVAPHRRRVRLAVVPARWREAVGFRLVEAGLRLVAEEAHPPRRMSPAP